MGITASYKQISEFEYATFKKSPLKAYQFLFGKQKDLGAMLKQFGEWAGRNYAKSRAITGEYTKLGLHERLRAVGHDPDRLSEADRRLFEEQNSRLEAAREEFSPPMPECFDIDKSWQAIHFLLTGQVEGGSPPLAWVVLGDAELPDVGSYARDGDPLRMLSAAQVQTIAQELVNISAEQLLSRATVAEMIAKDVHYVSEDEMTERDYISHHYERLRNFYTEAAERKNAVLVCLG